METNTIKKHSKLTPIDWELYNFIKQYTLEHPHQYVTHEQICEALPHIFKMNHTAVNKKCCSNIQAHILKINESPEIEKIIIYKGQAYKLAESEEEAINFIDVKFQERMNRLSHRMALLKDKVKRDGQGKLMSTRCVPMEDSQGRPYVETYVK